jgi:uncharacterized membrane protein
VATRVELETPDPDFWDDEPPEEPPDHGSQGWSRTPTGMVLISIVVVLALGTVAGIVALWPSGDTEVPNSQAFGGDSVGAEVVSATTEQCANTPVAQTCRTVAVKINDGPDAGKQVSITLGPSDYSPTYDVGSDVRVVKAGTSSDSTSVDPQRATASSYSIVDYDRRMPILWLGLALGICVIVVGRWRGALALIGLGVSLVLVTQFMVPAIIAGESPFWVALLGSLAVMFITVALSSGLGAQSLAATLGIAGSLLLASLLALLYAHLAHLNGFTSDLAFTLRQSGATVSLQGLVIAGMVIAALGVLADMAVSQASAVMALRRANPRQRAGELYRGAFAVGRDHFSATIHTLVFAYVGASLPLLILFKSAGVNFTDAINAQDVAEPFIGIMIGAIALIASVPLTTGLAALLAARMPASSMPEHGHHH